MPSITSRHLRSGWRSCAPRSGPLRPRRQHRPPGPVRPRNRAARQSTPAGLPTARTAIRRSPPTAGPSTAPTAHDAATGAEEDDGQQRRGAGQDPPVHHGQPALLLRPPPRGSGLEKAWRRSPVLPGQPRPVGAGPGPGGGPEGGGAAPGGRRRPRRLHHLPRHGPGDQTHPGVHPQDAPGGQDPRGDRRTA